MSNKEFIPPNSPKIIRAPIRVRLLLDEGKEDIVAELEKLKYNKRMQLVRVFEVLCESMPGFFDIEENIDDCAMHITFVSGKVSAVIKFHLEDLV